MKLGRQELECRRPVDLNQVDPALYLNPRTPNNPLSLPFLADHKSAWPLIQQGGQHFAVISYQLYQQPCPS